MVLVSLLLLVAMVGAVMLTLDKQRQPKFKSKYTTYQKPTGLNTNKNNSLYLKGVETSPVVLRTIFGNSFTSCYTIKGTTYHAPFFLFLCLSRKTIVLLLVNKLGLIL